jgi:alkylation response protein AidB-like acyl-CoA dehydrogenase
MNFDFSEEQKMLREQAHSFLRDKSPTSVVRNILEGDESYDQQLWQAIVELGWTATRIPEEYGGLGLGSLELCVIAEELGRSLAPTPFSSSVYLATDAILLAGSERQKQQCLPQLAAGEKIGTFSLSEGPRATSAENLQVTVEDGLINGVKWPVTDGDVADFAVIVATGSDGPGWYLVDLDADGVERKTVKSLDPTRSQTHISFSDVRAEPLGEAGQGWQLTEKLYDRAAVLFAFEQVGGSLAALDQACEYAKNRYAFGRSIASFQAIKHKLADMYVAATLARSNCYYGAWALSSDADELAVAAAAARLSAIAAYHQCAKENIQTHGGMGFTWEFDCHLYYRRARALAVNLGNKWQWEDKLISALESRGEVLA